MTIEKARRSLAVTDGNKIRYPNVFTGVDVEYEYIDARLKQQIYLSQQARDRHTHRYHWRLQQLHLTH